MNIKYVATSMTENKIAEILVDDRYLGSIFMSEADRYPGLLTNDMIHIVVAFPDAQNLNQLSVYVPKSEVAKAVEILASLERRPF